MKKIFLILLSLMLLTGCGSSPQEKRNKYDACVIEFKSKYFTADPSKRVYLENSADHVCVKFLK